MKDVDAAPLKPYAFGYDSPLWWGQLLMAIMEGAVIAVLGVAFLYERSLFEHWPPPGSHSQGLILPSLTLLLLLGSTIPMHIGDKAVLRCEWKLVKEGMAISIAMGVVVLVFQIYLWSRFTFAWNANVYASFIWFALGVHTTHMVVALLETIVIVAFAFSRNHSDRVRIGLNVDEIYWYFVAFSGVPIYAMVFFAPRIL